MEEVQRKTSAKTQAMQMLLLSGHSPTSCCKRAPGITIKETRRSVTANARRRRLDGCLSARTSRTDKTTKRLPSTDMRIMPNIRMVRITDTSDMVPP